MASATAVASNCAACLVGMGRSYEEAPYGHFVGTITPKWSSSAEKWFQTFILKRRRCKWLVSLEIPDSSHCHFLRYASEVCVHIQAIHTPGLWCKPAREHQSTLFQDTGPLCWRGQNMPYPLFSACLMSPKYSLGGGEGVVGGLDWGQGCRATVRTAALVNES